MTRPVVMILCKKLLHSDRVTKRTEVKSVKGAAYEGIGFVLADFCNRRRSVCQLEKEERVSFLRDIDEFCKELRPI